MLNKIIIIIMSIFPLLTLQTAVADAGSKAHSAKLHKEKAKRPRYDAIVPFTTSRDYARVRLKDKWGLIDAVDQRELIPPKYDEISDVYFQRTASRKPRLRPDYLIRVRLNGKWGYADFTGKEVITLKYDEVPPTLSEPLNRIKENGKYGYLDQHGRPVVPAQYDEAPAALNKRLNRVKLNGKYGYLDMDGSEVTPAKYDDLPEMTQKTSRSADPLMRVSSGGKYGYLSSHTGEEMAPAQYDIAPEFLFREKNKVKRDGKWGYLDNAGDELGAFRYEDDPCAFDKKSGEQYVFGERTVMRSKPDPSSDVIAQFSPGAKITVGSGTPAELTQGDEADKWYEATSGEKMGFVWGGDIADSAFTVSAESHKLLFLIRNRTNTEDCYKFKFEMKMLLDGKVLSERSNHSLNKTSSRVLSMEYLHMEGFSAPLNLLKVRSDFKTYNADAYARFGTSVTYYYIDDGKLNAVMTVAEEVGGEGKFKDHKFISELEMPDNKTRVDTIIYTLYSNMAPSQPVFLQETYQWDWDAKTFKKINASLMPGSTKSEKLEH